MRARDGHTGIRSLAHSLLFPHPILGLPSPSHTQHTPRREVISPMPNYPCMILISPSKDINITILHLNGRISLSSDNRRRHRPPGYPFPLLLHSLIYLAFPTSSSAGLTRVEAQVGQLHTRESARESTHPNIKIPTYTYRQGQGQDTLHCKDIRMWGRAGRMMRDLPSDSPFLDLRHPSFLNPFLALTFSFSNLPQQ